MRSTGSTAQIYERHTVPAILLHGRHALRGKNMQYDGTCVPYVHGHGVRIHYQTEGDGIAAGCLMPGGTGAVRSPTNLPPTSHRCLLPTCSQCWTISTSRRPTSAVTPGGADRVCHRQVCARAFLLFHRRGCVASLSRESGRLCPLAPRAAEGSRSNCPLVGGAALARAAGATPDQRHGRDRSLLAAKNGKPRL
jgi:hypothetical protein